MDLSPEVDRTVIAEVEKTEENRYRFRVFRCFTLYETPEDLLMEKNSVVQNIKPTEPGTKMSQSVKCPECGATCARRGQVFACPKHGTKPFEPGK